MAASLAYRTGITAQEPASSATLSASLTRVLVTLSSFFLSVRLFEEEHSALSYSLLPLTHFVFIDFSVKAVYFGF